MTRPGRALAVLAVLLCWNYPASAHSWYDAFCCSEKDCAPLADGASVTSVEGGFVVIMRPGDKPLFFPFAKVKPSQDSDWHACISPGGDPLCLYRPDREIGA